ncbi:MAG: serine--tRNA ligase [Candidatus Omnitrophota bacterium]
MLDIKFIRENPELIAKALKDKGSLFDLNSFLELDEKRRNLLKQIESLRAAQNKLSGEVNLLIRKKENPKEKITESKEISKKITETEKQFKEIKEKFQHQSLSIPNVPHNSAPIGDASFNRIIKTWGHLKEFNFKPLTHVELAERLDIIDFKRAAKITGSNFVIFKGQGAKLERALINFMLDLHTRKHNYKEVSPPFLVNRNSMTTTAQLPNLEEDMYRLKDDDYFLIPTAEVPLTNIHSNEILEEKNLPLGYVAYTACFRKEAGSYGKDTKGLVRVHQFDKVEMVKFVKPQDSYRELDKLLQDACKVIELLGISYRVVVLSTREMSFAASKCYDIEIYAPGVQQWLEVSSCSNFEDFQARRGNIRYRGKNTEKPNLIHTLNGSGVALARLVIAILENYQQKNGSVLIPKALKKYMDGKKRL